ncbi:UNVERIFIED_CONTAM: transposase-like protein [Paenibacillus sp. PvR008]
MACLAHVTNKIVPLIREWQNRPLQGVYAVVFLDAIHFIFSFQTA